MLFSRMVASRIPNIFEKTLKSDSEMTATGIDALTVRPTFKTRYSDDAPNITPKIAPTTTARTVSSFTYASGGTYGRNSGLVSVGIYIPSLMLIGLSISRKLFWLPWVTIGYRRLPVTLKLTGDVLAVVEIEVVLKFI